MTADDPRAETILLVDDDQAVRRVAAKVLGRSGYRVLEAGGGPEALALARGHEGPIDLLLTDVVMPRMSGRELSEALELERPGTRVLFMSAYTEDEVILRGVSVAEVRFLPKPFTLDALTRTVREALERPPGPRGDAPGGSARR